MYKYILIQGLRSIEIPDPNPIINELDKIASHNKMVIQVIHAPKIATWEHIFFGALSASQSFFQERNISKQLSFEILLYISGQRQIKIALDEFGMQSGENILLILGNSKEKMKQNLGRCLEILGGQASDEVMEITDSSKLIAIQSYFQINIEELNAIKISNNEESVEEATIKAVLNRIALVALEK